LKRIVSVLLMVGAVLAVAAPNTSADVKVVAECDENKRTKRPDAMIFACGDAGLQATDLSWKSWGGQRAKAKGTIIYKLCEPDCASGGVALRSGKVTLYGKTRCGRRLWVYQRARIKVWNGPVTKIRLWPCS